MTIWCRRLRNPRVARTYTMTISPSGIEGPKCPSPRTDALLEKLGLYVKHCEDCSEETTQDSDKFDYCSDAGECGPPIHCVECCMDLEAEAYDELLAEGWTEHAHPEGETMWEDPAGHFMIFEQAVEVHRAQAG